MRSTSPRVNNIEVIGVNIERHETSHPVLSRYRLNTKRPAVWLQRVSCWILGRLGCWDDEITVRYERHPIDGDTLLERLFKQSAVVRKHLDYYGKVRLLIGAEDYAEIMREELGVRGFNFSTTAKGGRGGQPTIFDMEVTVIPWIRGVVVLPEEFVW